MESTIVVGLGKAQVITLRLVGDGFSGNEADFNRVCDEIERAASQLDKAAIEAVVWDVEADDYVNRADQRLQNLADLICVETLRGLGWDKPHNPSVTVYGCAL